MFNASKVILAALFLVCTTPGGRCAEEYLLINFNAQRGFNEDLTDYDGIVRSGATNSKIAFSSNGGWLEWNCDLGPALYHMTIHRLQPANIVPMIFKIDEQRVATFDTKIRTGDLMQERVDVEITRQGHKTCRLEVSQAGPEINYIRMQSISAVASPQDRLYLVQTEVDMTFQDNEDYEMKISYEVHEGLNPDIFKFVTKILDWDCRVPADHVTASELEITSEEASHPALSVANLYLDFHDDQFFNSEGWVGDESEGDVMICVQVDLMYSPDEVPKPGPESMSMVRTQILQHVRMEGTFSTNEGGATKGMEPIGAAVIKNRDFESDATVNFYVVMCVIDNDATLECLDPQPDAKKNSFVKFLITSESEVVEIAEVTSFILEQENDDGSRFSFSGFDDSGKPRGEGITEVVYKMHKEKGKCAIVTQHVLTRFFDPAKPNYIQVYGRANLKFLDSSSRHRLLRARMAFEHNEVEDHVMTGAFEQIVELDDSTDAATAPNMLVSAIVSLIPILLVAV
jgi:hypothetical protein